MLINKLQQNLNNQHFQELPTKLIDLADIVDKNDSQFYEDNRGLFLHVSDFLKKGFCPRRFVLQRKLNQFDIAKVTGGHRIMWGIGRSVEAHIRDVYCRSVDNTGVFGKWSCKCERLQYEGYYNPCQPKCVSCGEYPSNYKEISLFDESVGIVGNPDLIITNRVNNTDYLTIVEIKSITKTSKTSPCFETLDSPIANHVLQASAYRHLLSLQGHNVLSKVLIIYACKDFVYGNPYKQFYVDVESKKWGKVIENFLLGFWKAGDEIKKSIDSNYKQLPNPICSTACDPKVKNCNTSTVCFNISV